MKVTVERVTLGEIEPGDRVIIEGDIEIVRRVEFLDGKSGRLITLHCRAHDVRDWQDAGVFRVAQRTTHLRAVA